MDVPGSCWCRSFNVLSLPPYDFTRLSNIPVSAYCCELSTTRPPCVCFRSILSKVRSLVMICGATLEAVSFTPVRASCVLRRSHISTSYTRQQALEVPVLVARMIGLARKHREGRGSPKPDKTARGTLESWRNATGSERRLAMVNAKRNHEFNTKLRPQGSPIGFAYMLMCVQDRAALQIVVKVFWLQ